MFYVSIDAKVMQTSAMKASFQIAECSLTSAKVQKNIRITGTHITGILTRFTEIKTGWSYFTLSLFLHSLLG